MPRLLLALPLALIATACAASPPPPTRNPASLGPAGAPTSPSALVGPAVVYAANEIARHASESSSSRRPEIAGGRAAPELQDRYRCRVGAADEDEIVASSRARATALCAELSGESCTCDPLTL